MNDIERIRDALSLALQFVPLESDDASIQADIDRIHDLISGNAIAWDETDCVNRTIKIILDRIKVKHHE